MSDANTILAMSTLAERLKEVLVERGTSQAQLARATGAKEPSVSKWLNGATKNLKGKNLVKAAAFLKISEAWLADGVGPKDREFVGAAFLTISRDRYDLLTETQKLAIEEWVNSQIDAYTGGSATPKSIEAA